MNRILFFICIFLVKEQYVSADSAVGSLCFTDEEIVFSCRSESGETISLCASPALNATDGFLQYRFGAIGNIPGFIFPKSLEHPSKYFQSGTVPYSGGGTSYIKFDRGKYSYTVFTGMGKGWKKEGLIVKKRDKQHSYIPCEGPFISQIGPDLFETLVLKKDPLELEFEIP
jgi:hypothetical protein